MKELPAQEKQGVQVYLSTEKMQEFS